jgi:hypothetical protein
MELKDITAENYFANITYQSDPAPAGKLKIPDADFLNCAIMLKLINELKILRSK